LEKDDTQGLILLDDVKQNYERISYHLKTILDELENQQNNIIENTNSLIILASIFLTIIIIFNINYMIHIFKDLMATSTKIKERAVLLDSIADGVYGVDTKGACMFINKKALEMIQFSEEEVLHKNQHELFHHHRPDGSFYEFHDCPIHKTVNDRITRECEETFVKKDGTFFPVSLTISPTSDGNAVVVFRDISYIKDYETHLEHEVLRKTKALNDLNKNLELKVAQEVEKNRQKDILLQQQTRLAAIGEMMGNIAHQWRQPLSAITTTISGLKLKEDFGILEPNDITNANDSIVHNAEFLSHTIDNFRNFFKKDQPNKKFFVSDAVKDTVSIIKASYDNHFILLKMDCEEDISHYGSDNLLSQVILNILANAKDALVLNNIENKIVKIILRNEKGNIVLKIQDNAGGINEGIKDKIFDPYFTTKHQSQGTGLGLYMSTQIIHTHFQGQIAAYNVQDSDGLGACFEISFPQRMVN